MTTHDDSAGFDLSAFKDLYLSEAHKGLKELRQQLTQLSQLTTTRGNSSPSGENPAQDRSLAEAYRLAHKLKGMSAAMRYTRLASLAEEMESWLHSAKQTGQPPKLEALERLKKRCDQFEAGLKSLTPPEERQLGRS
jgi:chemotaxis protein histidine kinase CheA